MGEFRHTRRTDSGNPGDTGSSDGLPTATPGAAVPAPAVHRRALDREILALALPALGALVAEPLFTLVDSAVVGHLGTPELAGLSLASTLLITLVGLCIFLAYATTAQVARLSGAGREAEAMKAGVDGLWLALALGVVLAVALVATAPLAVGALGAQDAVGQHAVTYLRWSAPGLPGMLLVLAATGVLRGLQDTRTPLVVAAAGAVLNAVLNIVLVYGAGLGIAGSGLGTAVTQLLMGAVLVARVARGARARGASLRPHVSGIGASARTGAPLLVRTVSLRAAILLTVHAATALGPVTLAGHQVVNSLWALAAFALDALAIAAQAMIGHALGAGDVARVRAILRRTVQWGAWAGAAGGLVLAAAGWWLAPLFTADPGVRVAVALAMLPCGLLLPLTGVVCVLDGVLIGAGDGRYLAWVGVANLVAYVPFVLTLPLWVPDGGARLAWLWLAWSGVFMGVRTLTTALRARGTGWLVTGA